MRKVVITGLGAVTPVGNHVPEMWEALQQGVCGIGPITHYDTTGRKVSLAGEVRDFDAESVADKSELRKLDRFVQFALASSAEAMQDSALNPEQEDLSRCGVLFSSGIGGLETIQRECEKGVEKGFDRISPHFVPMSIINMAAGQIAIRYGFHGMCSSVVTACASASNAIGDAFRQIRDGYLDVCLCGGSEACITPFGIGGFTALRALSTATDPARASIPFDRERNGFVMGEGAGALVLEEYEHALARGAHIYCELAGYGATCDAHHVTAPLEDGSMAAACMQMAMKDAGVEPEQVQYINAHGTSTQLNDRGETAAVRLAFGEHADHLCISSTKSMTGHLLGASGAVEAVITALCVHEDVVVPTIHYQVRDEDCNLDVVPNTSRKQKVDVALSNSLGFGGHNASLLFRKAVQA